MLGVGILMLFFCILGWICWIPLIIDKFEQAFEDLNMKHDGKQRRCKTAAIIAAFITLDFDGNARIDPDEFRFLVSQSVLIDKAKFWQAIDMDNNAELDIYEFVVCLLK